MKKIITILLFVVSFQSSYAQNLVENYSFEIYSSCPPTTSSIAYANGWYSSLGDPDYFNVCANSIVGVPSNICGFQYAATGSGYAGVLSYGSFPMNTLVPNIREYCTGTLSQPLTIGEKYFVSFKVVLMNLSSHAIDHIGAKFISTLGTLSITNNAQVYSTSVISDTLNWTVIHGSFIADSNYTYISIGNHFTDTNTIAQSVAPIIMGYNAYYFIDDVCVSTDSSGCFVEVGLDNHYPINDISIVPNPFTNQLTITANNNNNPTEITLYDITSRKLLQQTFTNNATINTGQLATGMYLYEVRNKNEIIKNGKVIKQ